MASSLKPTSYQTSSLRLLCHHCRQRFLPTLPQKRLLASKYQKNSDHYNARLLSDLDKLTETTSNSDFVKATSAAMGVANSKLGIGPPVVPPAQMESPLGRFRESNLEPPPHHLHVYSTKHNCHITLTDGKRQPLISVSTGNIGFRKGARGSYEAAFQLGAYMVGRIEKQGLLKEIHAIEIILRDFGPGREAFTKILLGGDGKIIRDRVVRVMDATKLKFGGVRSKRSRRL